MGWVDITWMGLIAFFIATFFMYVIFKFKFNRQLKKLRRDYNEKDNKSRKAGEGREPIGKLGTVENGELESQGDASLGEQHGLLPTATVEPVKIDKPKHRKLRKFRRRE